MKHIIVWLTMPTSVMITTDDNPDPSEEEVIKLLEKQTSLWHPKHSKLIGYSEELTQADKQKHPFFLRGKLRNGQSNR